MPAKKKTKKQQKTKSQKTPRTKMKATKPAQKKLAVKGKEPQGLKKKSAKKKVRTNKKKAATKTKPVRRNVIGTSAMAFPSEGRGARSGGQSGDLQGLSNLEGPDSESVDELLEEGNAFEAEVVTGVEHAGDVQTKEVHTHEVPEDDIPEEYLDKD
jgi:hypothetical protein